MSIPPSRFASDTPYHITNEVAGDSSAAASQGLGKKLQVDPQGLTGPSGEWIVNYDRTTGNYRMNLSSDSSQYINADSSSDYVITGSDKKLWGYLTVDPDNHTLAYVQDPVSNKVWQYDESTSTIKLVAQVVGDKTQIWTIA